MNPFLEQSLSQLLGQSPILLVYLIGFLLALIFWKRSKTASICTLIGTFLLLSIDVVSALLNTYLASHAVEYGWSRFEFGRIMAAVNIVANIGRAVGFVLVLIAVFTGRATRVQASFNTRRI
jgi:hypothetical protein